MTKHISVQAMYKRDEAIWAVFTTCPGWSMQDLADLHHLKRSTIHKILKQCAKRKSAQLETYKNYV